MKAIDNTGGLLAPPIPGLPPAPPFKPVPPGAVPYQPNTTPVDPGTITRGFQPVTRDAAPYTAPTAPASDPSATIVTKPGAPGTPGYTPDWNALLYQDPSWLSWLNDKGKTMDTAGAQRKAALQALVIGHGRMDGGYSDQFGDIDPLTQELAGKNQYSDTAQLQRNYDLQVEAFKRSLAARGGIQSGELQYGLNDADYQRGARESDLAGQFAQSARNALEGYANTANNLGLSEGDAITRSMGNVRASHPAIAGTAAGPDQTAALEADWQTKYGQPVYRGSDGALWAVGPDGSPIPFSPNTYNV